MKRQCKDIYHRKVWEEHHGAIPRDNTGRSYEIHHVDGNHNNNNINNLLCVTIEEHYRIHYDQGDYAACMIMFNRMKVAPEEKSRIARLANTGENNPQFGTRWITNGTINKKIQSTDEIPFDWKLGRYFNEDARKKFVSRPRGDRNNPRYNHTEYCFRNILTGEQVRLTYRDFYTKYEINPRGVRKLVKGQVEIFKNWTIV